MTEKSKIRDAMVEADKAFARLCSAVGFVAARRLADALSEEIARSPTTWETFEVAIRSRGAVARGAAMGGPVFRTSDSAVGEGEEA